MSQRPPRGCATVLLIVLGAMWLTAVSIALASAVLDVATGTWLPPTPRAGASLVIGLLLARGCWRFAQAVRTGYRAARAQRLVDAEAYQADIDAIKRRTAARREMQATRRALAEQALRDALTTDRPPR